MYLPFYLLSTGCFWFLIFDGIFKVCIGVLPSVAPWLQLNLWREPILVQAFLKEITSQCETKAAQWDKRSKVRSEGLLGELFPNLQTHTHKMTILFEGYCEI